MSYFKPVSISLSPNVEKDDVKLALNLIIRPWLWTRQKRSAHFDGQAPGNAIEELERQFREYLGVKYAISFNSGRSALYAILRALGGEPTFAEGSGEAKKVLMQAFTCNASINPVLWAKMMPEYVDCAISTFNIDIEDLKTKVRENPNAKILMVQHTFGQPANMAEILKICQENNLILIEDCAHALGAKYNGQLVGTFGKASFFSFSRDKVISSVYGGMAVTNDDRLGQALRQAQGKFGMPNLCWTWQQIWHPILLHFFILPIYNFLDLGKIFLVLSQWTHVLSKAVHWKEKRGLKPNYFPKALPNALAVMAQNQFKKQEKFYNHRKKLFEYYNENLKNTAFILPKSEPNAEPSYLRYTVKHKDAHDIIYDAWHKQNILLGDWYTTPIAPFDTKLEEMHYKMGMCENAEKLAKKTLNLPTHINISIKDAERIVNFLKKYA
ncbi:MAG: DegT/DnrJ/EryC1/StrS family aminotransferase [Candidatus Staskawiczbacteria bacterium]|nr:DegT/DnrJ/EryC1/StrS family aminotransferase [Candidatus Staskawiczbacteria bacterium]